MLKLIQDGIATTMLWDRLSPTEWATYYGTLLRLQYQFKHYTKAKRYKFHFNQLFVAVVRI